MSSSTLTLTRKFSLYETLLFKVLNKLPLGSLQMDMPDGHTLYFGSGNEVKALVRVKNPVFFTKCVLYGDIGFAESYLDGDWETDSIANIVTWFIINIDHNSVLAGRGLEKYISNAFRFINKLYHKSRKNTIDGAKKNISAHYDLGNDFYSLFLDKTMTYSSAIFQSPDQPLEEAQFEKYDRLCRKLKLSPQDRVLEIGSGWGGMALHAAKNYGCHVTTVTISEEQYKYAKDLFAREGYADKIDIRIQDYRTLEGNFDKIISIEMLLFNFNSTT